MFFKYSFNMRCKYRGLIDSINSINPIKLTTKKSHSASHKKNACTSAISTIVQREHQFYELWCSIYIIVWNFFRKSSHGWEGSTLLLCVYNIYYRARLVSKATGFHLTSCRQWRHKSVDIYWRWEYSILSDLSLEIE